jgi:selenocysteine-specific elongation factor
MLRPFILGTAGHIDHGKSTLVKTLTGTDPDRLPEEKARGMTIELGFAHLAITDAEKPDLSYTLGIVDVPGHADFVKNMVAGVTGIDIALFIVAADDNWMPQSEEHLQVLTYLGIEHAVVALTKADLAEDLEFSLEMLREELKGTRLEQAPIVPVSAIKGTGLEALKQAIATVLRSHPGALDIGKPRLHVDRAFSPTGVGTVVTGTLTGGALAGGATAVVQPLGREINVRSVQSHNSKKDHARAGMRTALNLPDLAIATKEKKDGVSRGDVITLARCGTASRIIDVRVEKSARPVPGQPGFTRSLRSGMKVRVHHGSAAHDARLYLLNSKTLEAGQSMHAELRFDEPMHAFAGDTFVLRDWSKRFTIGGGLILDPDAKRAEFRRPPQKAFLEEADLAFLTNPPDVAALTLAHLRRSLAVQREGFLAKSRFSEAEIKKAIDSALKAKLILSDAGWYLEATWWHGQIATAADSVRAHHAAQPESQGLSLSILRSTFEPRLPDKRLFDLLITHLTKESFSRTADTVRQGTHQAALPPALALAGEQLRACLLDNLDPPNPADLAPTPELRKALKFLIQNGEAIELSDKAVISRAVHDRIRQITVDLIKTQGKTTASEIREAVHTTRRILIPLLEKMDKEGITKRTGDFRILN